MRKILTTLMVSLMLLSADLVWSEAAKADVAIPGTTMGEAIIGFERGFLPNLGVGELLAGLPIKGVSQNGSFVTVAAPNLEIVRQLISLVPGVKYVEDNGTMKALAVPNDARYGSQYGPAMMGFPAAWGSIGYGSSAVTVALIDSGVLATHEDLAGPRLLQGHDYISNDSVPDDTCGHGTHTIGTVGATVNNSVGVAGMSQASLLPMKALANSGGLLSSCSGSYTAIAQAIMDAADQGAKVISMSIGGAASSVMQNAVNYAYSKGSILVAAAGNDGSANSIDYPGAYPNVIAVGALDSTKNKASYSDMGPQIDIAAPGSAVLSTYSSNTASYSSLSGTSMATPHVAGAIALALSCAPTATQSQVTNALYSTADDLGTAGFDQSYGNGLARADKLVYALCPNAPAPPNQNPVANFTTTPSGLLVNVNGSTSTDPDGNPLSYAWTFGDGGTATGVTASHTYASAGTYTITLTVDDGKGGSNVKSSNVTVSADPDPSTPTVVSGQTLSVSVSSTNPATYFKIFVAAGKTQFRVTQSGPACGLFSCPVDSDLYVRLGQRATTSAYNCRSNAKGNAETCTITSPTSGWWYFDAARKSGSGTVSVTPTIS
ncbi:MAG: S8 family serine peptidase [Actinobacteria bacterium]|nr:S8 family serine peptidase [Actinomycetota bacterium]